MTLKIKCSKILYFLGSVILIISGIILGASAPGGMGVLLFYNGKHIIPVSMDGEREGSNLKKINLFWSLFFLGISVLILFSLIKIIAGILFRGQTAVISKWVLPLSAIGCIFYELIYRVGSNIMNRIAAMLLLIVFIQSTGSYILGGFWIYSDLVLGFLSFLITAIMSSRNAYSQLSYIIS